MVFKIKYKDKKSDARVGILKTKSGSVETPFFMPVATKTAVKFIDSKRLSEIGIRVIISNALILSFRPGVDVVKKLGGIGKFMNFNGINFSDSGGFQMYSDSIYIKSGDTGVLFRNPINGSKVFMTPEENMKIQINLGGDVAMCLDRMPLYEESKKEIKKAVELTSKWARRCKKEHDLLQKNIKKEKRQLLFGISQGGIYKDLREESIRGLVEMNFEGYAVGGFGMGETFNEKMKIVKHQKEIIPENKPVYLMGIGNPIEILEAIGYGFDIFDSKMPTQNARRGTLFTSNGKLKILNKKFEIDKSPIDKNCKCFVCKNYSRAYVRFLLKEEESVGKELASYHNIYYLQNLLRQAKEEIKKNNFKEFIKKIKKKYS
ncbi:MAG: tRNA guanosine(34) transglycosylase Tgt [archaeon]